MKCASFELGNDGYCINYQGQKIAKITSYPIGKLKYNQDWETDIKYQQILIKENCGNKCGVKG